MSDNNTIASAKVFSPHNYPRSIIPIERPGAGTTELLEIIFTSTLLTDEDLKAAGYKTRPWKQEDGAFPYAMKKIGNAYVNPGDADFSVIIYCPEAYTRSFVDLPAFKIFDLEFNPPPVEEPTPVPEGQGEADDDSVTPLRAECNEQSTSRPIKPLPKRAQRARGMTEPPAAGHTQRAIIDISVKKREETAEGTSARPLKRKHSEDDNRTLSSQWPLLTPILASIFSAFEWGPASKVTECSVEEDKDNENGRPCKRQIVSGRSGRILRYYA